MELTPEELRMLYNSIIKPFGHPDPVGYVVRALIESGADPDYLDPDGNMGFMPVDPATAQEMVGTGNVATLQGNVTTTLLMDQMLFEKYLSVDDMITAFHFGEESVGGGGAQAANLIAEVNASRPEMLAILDPPKATVADVVRVLNDGLKTPTASKMATDFVTAVLGEG